MNSSVNNDNITLNTKNEIFDKKTENDMASKK